MGKVDFWRLELQRAFGLKFFFSVILICSGFFMDTDISAKQVILDGYHPQGYECISGYVEYVLLYGNNYKLYLIFSTMGYAFLLPEDWKNGIMPYYVKKMGSISYAASRILLSALSGGMAAGVGFLLYLFVLGRHFPVLPSVEYMNAYQYLESMPYYGELTISDAERALTCFVLIFWLSGATWTALAAGLSLWLKSKYLVFIFPYLLSRSYIELAKALKIPVEIRIDRWFSGLAQPFSISVCLVILSLFTVIVCIVSVFLFEHLLKWRLEDGWNE